MLEEQPQLNGDNALGIEKLHTCVYLMHNITIILSVAAQNPNHRTMSYKETTLFDAYTKISAQAERLDLSQAITNRAKVLFKHSHVRNILRMRRPIDAKVSACLYFACRQGGFPRTFKQEEHRTVFQTHYEGDERTGGHDFHIWFHASILRQIEYFSGLKFILRVQEYIFSTELPSNVQHTATSIASKTFDMDIVLGRSPISVVATAIYMASQASGHKRTQTDVGVVAGVVDVTIRRLSNLMYPHADKLFPRELAAPIDNLRHA